MKLIERTEYLNKLKDVIGTPDIKVITGVRRSGKSKLLNALKDYLSQDNQSNIIHINFNTPVSEQLLNYKDLYEYIENHYVPNKTNFVLIDEIQMCDGFEKCINWIYESEKYDIYITGSNAFLLSSDLATLFTGRTFEIKVYPFSLKEYMTYFELNDYYSAFNQYLLNGGMSGSYAYKNEEDKYSYISEVFNTLIIRDLKQKYKIRNLTALDKVINFLMDNISNLTSSRNIADTLKSNHENIDHKTVSKYIDYLCNAFLFYKIQRYDIQGKKYLNSTYKYYLSDHGFRFAIQGTKNLNIGRTIENIVAIELLRRGYEVYVGVLYKKEIDFVAMKRNEKIYIQVSDNISDDSTFQREIDPLLKIKDAYPRILLARTNFETYQYEGIQIIDISKWLSNR